MATKQKRPYKTFYYAGNDVVAYGHSASEKGALRGAAVRVILGERTRAEICLDGACVHTIKFNKHGRVEVTFGRSSFK